MEMIYSIMNNVSDEVISDDDFDEDSFEMYVEDTHFRDEIANKLSTNKFNSYLFLTDLNYKEIIDETINLIGKKIDEKKEKKKDEENLKNLKKDKREYKLDFLDLLVGEGLIEIKEGSLDRIRKEFYKSVVKSKDFQSKDEFLNFLSTLVDFHGNNLTLQDISDIEARLGHLKWRKKKEEQVRGKNKKSKESKFDKWSEEDSVIRDIEERMGRRNREYGSDLVRR